MQCRDKGKWRTMTKFEIRNNMAYASQMQFEVLRRALWVQPAHPDTVFNWQFLERAAQDPKMTSYLSHGVKAKMCETTPFVNSVGTQYIASRAQIEQACDSLRQQGSSMHKSIGLTRDDLCPPTTLAGFTSRTIVEALVIPKVKEGPSHLHPFDFHISHFPIFSVIFCFPRCFFVFRY